MTLTEHKRFVIITELARLSNTYCGKCRRGTCALCSIDKLITELKAEFNAA